MHATTRHPTPRIEPAERDLGAPLDALLVSAASATSLHRWLPGGETRALVRSLAGRPSGVARLAADLASELARVAVGTSTFEPSSRDRRFADPGWKDNPFLRRSVQAYLAAGVAANRLLDLAELDERHDQRIRFLVDNVIDALAPSNMPWLNPTALKAAVDTGGLNLLRGARQLIGDLRQAPRVPSMVDTSAFSVGEDLGTSSGSVVFRTPVFELVQYAPTTADVKERPLLLVPPTINKFYVLDLAPGRSIVEHLVASGHQVFAISWRNPTARHADWGLDTYVHAVLEALDTTREITQSQQAMLFAACSGGIIASMAASYLAATGRLDELAAMTLAVTVLDQANAGLTGSMVDEGRAQAAIRLSARQGFLDGRALAEVFAWLRPNDLVWNYWVNNYLLGRKPPAFDILYWNADTTRMPAALHADFLRLALDNKLVTPGEATSLGLPVDLGKVTTDAYVIGGVSDHITPWEACFRSARLLGGDTRFVLSTSGHIAALVNPPTNNRSSFQTASVPSAGTVDPKAWQSRAEMVDGTWWDHHAAWLDERAGGTQPAPAELGRGRFRPLADAPGTYVHDK